MSPKFCKKSAFESQLQNFAYNSIWIHNSPNGYRNDRNRVRFPQNQTPLNLELQREINYRFSEMRQILPVTPKGTRPEVVHATINSSVLWNICEVLTLSKNMRLLGGASSADVEQRRLFSKWVLSVGDGEIGDDNDDNLELDIPSYLLIPNSGDPLASIVENTYSQLLQNMNDITYFQNRAILAPKNSIVDTINDYMLNLIPGEEKTYLSYDTPLTQNVDGQTVDDVHTPEFLNTIYTSGLPNHKLRLKSWSSEFQLCY
ncbi:unnamed protein product [Trifolium pratense]|uniref:Uncharacterized protein n=1 Tax=Trifolium pratense TaxID=57577 RepID=A0ACB0IRN0_TRIPR|nr:unnamed protein product [Trifolium pratense]